MAGRRITRICQNNTSCVQIETKLH
jgi:hypothetical protein